MGMLANAIETGTWHGITVGCGKNGVLPCEADAMLKAKAFDEETPRGAGICKGLLELGLIRRRYLGVFGPYVATGATLAKRSQENPK